MTISGKTDPDLQADLKYLRREHGLNDILFDSLLASKTEARAHIRFFKRMVFISNGAVMTIGLYLMGWSFKHGLNGRSVLSVVIGFIGLAIFLWFCRVFMRGVRSVQAIERIAQKHDLI